MTGFLIKKEVSKKDTLTKWDDEGQSEAEYVPSGFEDCIKKLAVRQP